MKSTKEISCEKFTLNAACDLAISTGDDGSRRAHLFCQEARVAQVCGQDDVAYIATTSVLSQEFAPGTEGEDILAWAAAILRSAQDHQLDLADAANERALAVGEALDALATVEIEGDT